MSNRIDLTAELERSRQPIDAGWSKRTKVVVGGGAVALSGLAIGLGVLFMARAQPPGLPTSFDEAVGVIASSDFDRLDETRQAAYLAEAARLMRESGQRGWRGRGGDGETRDAMRKIMEQRFDDAARRFARGEDPFSEWRNRERPQLTDEQRERFAQLRENMTEDDRADMREQMRQQVDQQLTDALATGNSQDTALRSEMTKRLGGMGPGARRGGGFRGGGRGG